MELATKDLTDNERSHIRLALDERITNMLTLCQKWTLEIELALAAYYKVGGYFTQEQFERFAKIRKEV